MCAQSSFAHLTHYSENIGDLSSSGSNEIVLEDGVSHCSSENIFRQEENTTSTCGAILYRYRDGRNQRASCPSGTELQMYVVGTVGAIEYIIEPSTSGVALLGGLPSRLSLQVGSCDAALYLQRAAV
jgi:hypothetical protein